MEFQGKKMPFGRLAEVLKGQTPLPHIRISKHFPNSHPLALRTSELNAPLGESITSTTLQTIRKFTNQQSYLKNFTNFKGVIC